MCPHFPKGEETPIEAVGGTKTPEIPTKVGATPRVEKEAGESEGVVTLPPRSSQRPEMPVAQGFFDFCKTSEKGGHNFPAIQKKGSQDQK